MGTLLVAFVTNHRKAGFFVFRRPTEGWEYIMNLVAALFAVACLGPGEWSLDNAIDFAPHHWWSFVIVLVVGVGGATAHARHVLAAARAEARRELGAAPARSCSTSSGSTSRQSPTMPTSAASKIGAFGVGVDREHGARGAHADGVVELAARADARRTGAARWTGR